MTDQARVINELYIGEMMAAGPATVLGRVRDLWWQPYLELTHKIGVLKTLDRLDACMDIARDRLLDMAAAYAARAGAEPGSDTARQLASQFLKSNTGKMFERFVGLALAQALASADAPYAVQPFRADCLKLAALTRDDFVVEVVLGDGVLLTPIDADLFAFNPTRADDEFFMISVKSTLKDRFHNVPFWNLLRRCAISADFPDFKSRNPKVLGLARYVAVCSDLAREQPDFSTDAGARNLLQIDAALLDSAYVTASRAKGLPVDCGDQLDEVRQHAFYRYSCFFEYLTAKLE